VQHGLGGGDHRSAAIGGEQGWHGGILQPRYVFAIQEFLLLTGANEGTASLVGPDVTQDASITVDGGATGTGAVLSDVAFQAVNSNVGTTTSGFIAGNGTDLATIVARNGYGYVTEPNVGNPGDVEQFTISKTMG